MKLQILNISTQLQASSKHVGLHYVHHHLFCLKVLLLRLIENLNSIRAKEGEKNKAAKKKVFYSSEFSAVTALVMERVTWRGCAARHPNMGL